MKKINFLLILLLLIPNIVFAYSNKVILGGENIGINIESNGILIVGFYKVNGKYLKSTPELKKGDYILKAGNESVSSINELTNAIEKNIINDYVELTIKRGNDEKNIKLYLATDGNTFKTGLFVKDSLSGIGTLTYIDPETKIYGALGHEIIESNTNQNVEVKTGNIFESVVTEIKKSANGTPGEKKAKLNNKNIYGTINKNSQYGLFGNYTKNVRDDSLIEIANPNQIKTGGATILTTLTDNEKKEYKINITKINEYNKIKNIHFEIIDEELLNKTGGIIQGMSGSPIIQNDKLIGAVTHVIVDNVKTGYGIFITTMLEAGES